MPKTNNNNNKLKATISTVIQQEVILNNQKSFIIVGRTTRANFVVLEKHLLRAIKSYPCPQTAIELHYDKLLQKHFFQEI